MGNYRTNHPFTAYRYGPNVSSAVKILIIINVAVFLLSYIAQKAGLPFLHLFGLTPGWTIYKLMLWQPVTYMFVHAGIWHLIINMIMLWMFGSTLEEMWGKRMFLIFYFFTGIGAGLCVLIMGWGSLIPTIGASGVIFGLLVAHAMLFPDSIILFFFIFPMKMKYAAWILAGVNLWGALTSPGSGISYMAHLGGGIFGYLYLRYEVVQQFLSFFHPGSLILKWERKKTRRKNKDQEQFEETVDSILEKISRQGIHSLTKEERKILDKRSRKNR